MESLDIPPSTSTTYALPSGGIEGHSHTVIFLHGREDYGEDLAQYFFDSRALDNKSSLADLFPSIKWVFPTAKLRYSAQRDFEFSSSSFAEALKGEEIISQWFDIWNINTPEDKEELMVPGLQESIRQVIEIIKEEASHVPLSRIILGGISQGCATAIYTLLSSGMAVGGFIGLCSWLPFQSRVESRLSSPDDLNKQVNVKMDALLDNLFTHSQALSVPMFLSHSHNDETVPFALGQGLHQTIERFGFQVTWKEYEDGGHWIHPQYGVEDIATFIRSVM